MIYAIYGLFGIALIVLGVGLFISGLGSIISKVEKTDAKSDTRSFCLFAALWILVFLIFKLAEKAMHHS